MSWLGGCFESISGLGFGVEGCGFRVWGLSGLQALEGSSVLFHFFCWGGGGGGGGGWGAGQGFCRVVAALMVCIYICIYTEREREREREREFVCRVCSVDRVHWVSRLPLEFVLFMVYRVG